MSQTHTPFQTVDALADEQTLLLRVDINAPVEDGVVQDTKRFERHAETIAELRDDGHSVVVLAHQGRPGRDTYISLEGHAEKLASHLESDVGFVEDLSGEQALDAVDALEAGDVLLLENVRFEDAELADATPAAHAESEFVETLSSVADCYVNDAYSAAHRAHASIVGFPERCDSYAGRVMEDEYSYNTSVREREFDGQVTMVLGGTKASDVVHVMDALADRIDQFLVGGIVGELCLRARGADVGYDVGGTERFDEQFEELRATLTELLSEHPESITLPLDLAGETEEGERVEVPVDDIAKDRPFLDIGSDTVAAFEPVIENSEAVFLKGALGVFEDERFSVGTAGVLSTVADTDCFSVVGGGDTARAIDMYGVGESNFDHVSIAGGAYIRALTGESLPAVEALRE